jgi:Cu(I)/Ag(I) efflux system membrane protein CusA/SilA
MMSDGTGADVTQRIAAPVLGGMFTVLLLSLLVFPVIYSLVLEFEMYLVLSNNHSFLEN